MRFWLGGPRIGPLRAGVLFGGSAFHGGGRSYSGSGAFVYVIEGAHDRIKIGISADPSARVANLQTGSPFALSLAYSTWAGDRAFDVEREAHALLARQNAGGEWFACSREAAVAAINAAAAHLCVALDAPSSAAAGPRPSAWTLTILLVLAAISAMFFHR